MIIPSRVIVTTAILLVAVLRTAAPAAAGVAVTAQIEYLVPLSRDQRISDTDWLRAAMDTGFRVVPSAQVRKRRESTDDDGSVTIRGPYGVAVLTVSHEPIWGFEAGPKEMWTGKAWKRSLTVSEKANLERHTAILSVVFHPSSKRPDVRAMGCTAVLRVVSRAANALGVMNRHSGIYTSVGLLGRFLDAEADGERPNFGLVKLLLNIQAEVMDRESRVYTSGMDQFGLPELEMWVKGTAAPPDLELVAEVAYHEMMGVGGLKVGELYPVSPKSVKIRVARARSDGDSPRGVLGAVQLAIDRPGK